MLSTPASRLRPLIAAIGLLTCTLAGADSTAIKPALIGDSATHHAPRGDTPHDSLTAVEPAKAGSESRPT